MALANIFFVLIFLINKKHSKSSFDACTICSCFFCILPYISGAVFVAWLQGLERCQQRNLAIRVELRLYPTGLESRTSVGDPLPAIFSHQLGPTFVSECYLQVLMLCPFNFFLTWTRFEKPLFCCGNPCRDGGLGRGNGLGKYLLQEFMRVVWYSKYLS